MDKRCDNCFFAIHYPWVCKEKGLACADWRDRNGGNGDADALRASDERELREMDAQGALEMYESGLTDPEIAKLCGVTLETVLRWRREHRLTPQWLASRIKSWEK